MSFLQKITNEAYDEDMKASREALQRYVEQVKMFGTEYSEPITELDNATKLTFTRLFTVFSNEIDKSIQLYYQEALIKDTGNLTLFYNQLASFINGLTTQNLSQTNINASNLIRKIDNLIPKMTQLYTIASEQNYTDKNAVKDILLNIKTHNYGQVALVFDDNSLKTVLTKNDTFKDSLHNATLLFDKIMGVGHGSNKLKYLTDIEYIDIQRAFNEVEDIKNQYIARMGSPNVSSTLAKQKVDSIIRDLKSYEIKNIERNREAIQYENRVIELKRKINNVDLYLITQIETNINTLLAQAVATPATMTATMTENLKLKKEDVENDLTMLTTMNTELNTIQNQLVGVNIPFNIVSFKQIVLQLNKIERSEKIIHDKYAFLIRTKSGPKTAYLTNDEGERVSFGTEPSALVKQVSIPDENLVFTKRIKEEAVPPLPLPIMQANNIPILLPASDFEANKRVIAAANIERINISNKEQAKELEIMKRYIMKVENDSSDEFDAKYDMIVKQVGEKKALEALRNFVKENEDKKEANKKLIIAQEAERNKNKPVKIKERDIQKQKEFIGEQEYDIKKFKSLKNVIFKQILERKFNKFTKASLDDELYESTKFTKNRLTSLNMMSETYLDKSIGEIEDIENQPVMEVGLEGQGKPSHFRGYKGGMYYDGE